MRKKNKTHLIILAVIALLSVAAATAVLSYNHVDHSPWMSKQDIARYNSAITAVAMSGGYISSDEFALIESVSKTLGGHTTVTFRVYRLPEGAALGAYTNLRVGKLPANFAPEEMGTGEARLPGGSLDRVTVTVTYNK